MTLFDLFVEHNVWNLKSLISIYNNQLDWLDELLYDDPWNTVAKSRKTRINFILNRLFEIDSNGSDWDVDPTQIII